MNALSRRKGNSSHRRNVPARAAFISALLVASARVVSAQNASQPILAFAVERSRYSEYVDLGTPGLSPGDLYIWGPNPLYDSEDVVDTGAKVQGKCVVIDGAGTCMASEIVSYVLGGTLHVQGVLSVGPGPTTLTITGGTFNFRGATGTVTITPLPDGARWNRVYEIWVPSA